MTGRTGMAGFFTPINLKHTCVFPHEGCNYLSYLSYLSLNCFA